MVYDSNGVALKIGDLITIADAVKLPYYALHLRGVELRIIRLLADSSFAVDAVYSNGSHQGIVGNFAASEVTLLQHKGTD